ncbi:DNA polymerase I [Chloroflexota bacterium]
MEKPLFLLFDGHALIHRAFHALPPLTVSRTGEPTGAVYGFLRMLLKVIQEFNPPYCAITFDRPAPTFRHLDFKDYKAHRPEAPEELRRQFSRVRQIVEALNITAFEMDGYEADDLLGTLSSQAAALGLDTVIVTGDADALQLVSPRVKVLVSRKTFGDTILYDEEAVRNKYGIAPQQIPDFKGLKGDPTDNIPGVSGIGDKTATKLIQQFGSIKGVYEHIDDVTPVKVRETLIAQKDRANLSKHLATIVTDAPVTFEMAECGVRSYDRERLLPLFREMEFLTLLDKIPKLGEQDSGKEVIPDPDKLEGEYLPIDTAASLENLVNKLSCSSSIIVHLIAARRETASVELVGIAFSTTPGVVYYLPLGEQLHRLEAQQSLNLIKPILSDAHITKTSHNGREFIGNLAAYGIELDGLEFDTVIAAHLLGEKSTALKALALGRLGIELTPLTELIPKGALIPVDLPVAADHACAETDAIGRLCPLLRREMEEQGLNKLFTEVEMPLVPILARMERNGIALDTNLLRQMSQSLGIQLLNLEQEIYSLAGHKFNINSPQQMGAVLFGELNLPGAKKTKTGYSTDVSVLERLKGIHPIIELIMEYRQLIKLKSTYIDALPALINPKTGRIHTSFNQAVTATGRLSSSEPNLQNIPVRGVIGRQVRQAFIAEVPYLLLGGDYSQIELRILAHLSQDSRLLSAFQKDEDIHAATASEVFGVDLSEVTAEMRRVAKVVNFGIIYGMSDYGLEQASELSRGEASDFIFSYFQRYPGVKDFLESTRQQAKEQGYVQTILGRRRYIAELSSSNRQVREAGERMAINMPVQGTAADIIKLAMINLQREIDARRLKSKMLLQVHDELLFEVHPEELDQMKALLTDMMSGAMELSVPLKVDIKAGSNWGEMK